MFLLFLILTVVNLTVFFKKSQLTHQGVFTKWRVAMLESLLTVSFLTYLFVEILSFFNIFNQICLSVCWFMAFGFTVRLANRSDKKEWLELFRQFTLLKKNYFWFLILFLTLGLAPLLFLAIYNAPNNLDSMNYHLARITQWIQNQNVGHYATNHPQQLYHNVFAEYLLANVLLLTGNDYLVDCVQFSMMIAALIAGTLIARQFGLNYKNQLIAMMLMFSLPISLLESTTTQNDLTAGFYFLAFLFFGIKFIQNQEFIWWDALFMALALGLGGFTKYPVFFFALPFCFWFGIVCLSKYGILQSLRLLGLGMGLIVLIFTPFFIRNYTLFESVLSPEMSSLIHTENIEASQHGIKESLANVSKNLGLHLGLPSGSYNTAVESAIVKFNHFLGFDINDERLSLVGTNALFKVQFFFNEDTSGNFLMLFLLIISLFLLIFQRKNSLELKLYTISIIIAYIVYCSLVKWQMFSSRTQLGVFLASAVLVACVFSRYSRFPRLLLLYFLLLVSIPYIYGNPMKPVFPVNYLAKKVIHYIPSALAVAKDDPNASHYPESALLRKYYDFSKPFAPLKFTPDKKEKVLVFDTLDTFGYYRKMEEDVFNTSRFQQYFMHDPNQDGYKDFELVLQHLPADTKHLGMIFAKRVGFYHLWSMFKTNRGNDIAMKHVLYAINYEKLPNVEKPFIYQYIISDNEKLIKDFINPADIASIQRCGEFLLIKMKQSSDKRYTYDRPIEGKY